MNSRTIIRLSNIFQEKGIVEIVTDYITDDRFSQVVKELDFHYKMDNKIFTMMRRIYSIRYSNYEVNKLPDVYTENIIFSFRNRIKQYIWTRSMIDDNTHFNTKIFNNIKKKLPQVATEELRIIKANSTKATRNYKYF
jgi:hypothetical protein